MKTFTTYAEKKAKQILNLLQGYTKSIRLTAILILLLMGVGNMSAADITSDGTARLYFNMSTYNWWISGNGDNNFAYFFKDSKSAWSAHSVQYSGNTYYVVIPKGTWNTVILTRNNTTTTPSWDNKWNQSTDITLSATSNYLSKFKDTGNSGSTTWGTAIKPTSTASVASSAASVFVGAPANLTASLTSNTDINTIKSVAYSTTTGASITGNTFTATAEGTYTVTANVTYHPNGYPSLTSTATATTTITASVPAEETNEVSVTYMCDATEVSPAIAEIVGVETEKSFTAPTVTGYNFTGWTIGAGITLKAGTASDATITVVTKSASSDYTLVANYEEVMETVYFINTPQWTSVKAYAYSPENHTWPGVDATKEAEKIGEYEVYSYTATQGKYANVIFNGSGGQTADLAWTSGKYYIHNYNGNTGWYTQAEAEDILLVPVVYETVYFVNNKNWSLVQIHAWNGGSNNGWPGQALTATGEKVEGFDVYSFEAAQGTYTNLIFNNKEGDAGEQSENYVWTADKYYYMGAAENYAGGTLDEVTTAVAPYALATDVYLAGEMTNWDTNKKEFKKATGEATTASVTVALTAQSYEFQLVIGETYYGNTGTMKRGGNAVHEGGWSFEDTSYGANCKIVADIAGDYTFTWNLTTNKLTVAYPPLPKFTVSATATNGTVTGAGEYEQDSEATLVATPNDGYVFVNWTEGGEVVSTETTYTFTVTKAVELVANFEEAQEETHTVTVSYMCNTTSIKDVTTPPVGVETPVSIEAPVIEGYTFQSWTIGDGIKTDNENTDNPISIRTKSTGPYTLTANYTENPYVYFVNAARWTTVNIYAWVSSDDQNKNSNWPGIAMTIEPEKISGYDVYKYVMPAGKNFDKIIFNNKVGDNGEQTGNLDWEDGKYYVYSAEQWVDKNEVADLLPKPVIYFRNHLGWENVYVYFFNTENWGADGASSWDLSEANGRVCEMEKVGATDIYKFDYSGKDFVPGNVIAFTKDKQPEYDNFHQTEAAYRTDYNPSMELYIPQKTSSETKNETEYFNKGLWMKYNSTESGYELAGTMLDNNWTVYEPFTASAPGNYHFDIALSLSGNHTYEFKVKNIKNDWYGKLNTTITATQNDLVLEKGSGDTYNVKLTTTSAGNYIFSIDLSEGTMKVSVEYPLMVGDYRMVYVENEVLGEQPYAKFHPAQSIRGITEGEKLDTVSFFINKTNGENPAILLQRCSNINGATITWEDIAIQYINDISGATPTAAKAPAKKSAELYIGDGCPAVTKDAVYNFVLKQTNTDAQILAENTHLYEGNYYIRTDGAAGGWRKYLTTPDNIMTHSQTALTHGGYDYYFCEWMLKGNNVKYVVANDYSYCVSDTLAKDDIVTDENGNLPADANVRYTWNSSTNALKRAYINGSGKIADRYLVLIGNEYLKDASGNAFPDGTGDRTGLHANETTFADMGNWLYQVDVKASAATLVKLTANYNGTIQYFNKGGADSFVNIITGATNYYKFRLIYDFKTNYLLCGLIEDGNINETITVDEAMISRSHHDPAQTFQVAADKSITTIKTVYGVMNFNKTKLNDDSKSQYERALYWVSFPFGVKLDEAFGFGNYGEHWIMEYYDGKERAEKGLWKEPTYSYWKYITNPNYILEAGKGYVLCLDLDLLKESASLWDNTDDIALYFPSKDGNITINSNPALKDTEVKPLTCTIERDDRDIYDSNWNIIGVPSYANISDFSTKIDDVEFYYQYNAADNSYESQEATTFNTMHAYMVQFAGTIQWAYKTVAPAQMAARKQSAGKDQYTLRLALQQEDAQCDHTFIRLQEDNATAEFDMNYDLCKIINRGANIYSMIGNVEVAANVLPVEERIIPLGLDIEEDGNYTFAMPDGTDGITAILIDYETGKETNLLLADYTTELREGTNNERFALRVRPNHVATEVENTILTDSNDNAKKYIIDGALYLLRDGKLYDAQGRMIQQ